MRLPARFNVKAKTGGDKRQQPQGSARVAGDTQENPGRRHDHGIEPAFCRSSQRANLSGDYQQDSDHLLDQRVRHGRGLMSYGVNAAVFIDARRFMPIRY